MKMTPALKEWLIKNCSVKADATDDEFRKAAGEAFISGKLSTKLYEDMTKSALTDESEQFSAKLDRIANGLEKTIAFLVAKDAPVETPEQKAEKEAKEKAEKLSKEKSPIVEPKTKQMSHMAKMFGNQGSVEGEEKDVEVRVKEAAEMYSDTKSTLTYPTMTKGGKPHPLAGQVVKDFSGNGGRVMNTPSERDMAVVGAWGKFMCAEAQMKSKTLAWMKLRQHEKELILYAMENMNWGGATDGGDYHDIDNQKLSPVQQKGLIDDSTSGGTEAVPIVFDDMIVSTPILNGELFPLVNLVPLDKGRRIQGARAGIVSSEWGGVDDTSVTLFDTSSYVSAFDTTIYRWQGSICIGLDFLSDTPVDFAQFLTTQYGEVMLKDLDNVIATGNGTTQPEGIMNKSGVASVLFTQTSTVQSGLTVATLGDYEMLRFGVHKREHLPNLMKTAVFCSTDVNYQRAMSIPVGNSDARRLNSVQQLGNYDGYTWMGRPYKINESFGGYDGTGAGANTSIFYAIMGRYRMYRRRGLVIKNSVEGDTLIRRNEMLMVAMARYGGQLERAACACKTTTAPA